MNATEMTEMADTTMLAVFTVAFFLCIVLIAGACLATAYAEILTGTETSNRLIAAVAATFIVVLLIAGANALVGAIVDHGWTAVLRAGR